MQAEGILVDAIRAAGGKTVNISRTEKSINFYGSSLMDMYITVDSSCLYSGLSMPVNMLSIDLLGLLRRVKVFSEIEFSLEQRVAKAVLKEEECTLLMECKIDLADKKSVPDVNLETLVELNVKMVQSIVLLEAVSVEISFLEDKLEIVARGQIRVEAEQKVEEYIKNTAYNRIFILSADAFATVISLCKLNPQRVLFGVNKSLCVFYLYFKDITITLLGSGNIV
ncbi:hypothetical protein NEOKW01_1441 [Nematocida sp. AWRm80]|nr:hypothetical protein NEOKW01_1441 [Nematocida sp. AWRm80]